MAMMMTWPYCFPSSGGMRWKKFSLWICKELLSTYLHGGSGWAQPKLRALCSTWIVGNPGEACGHRQRYHHPLHPNSNLPWSHALIASSPSSTAWKASVEKSEPVISCYVSWLAQHGAPTKAPTRGTGGGNAPWRHFFLGAALLVKRRNSNWFFTNEPEVRFRFRFQILVKVGPTIHPGLNVCSSVPSRLARCPEILLQWNFQN